MTAATSSCCVLNGGNGAWAFEGLARPPSSASLLLLYSQPGGVVHRLIATTFQRCRTPRCALALPGAATTELAEDGRVEIDGRSGHDA